MYENGKYQNLSPVVGSMSMVLHSDGQGLPQ